MPSKGIKGFKAPQLDEEKGKKKKYENENAGGGVQNGGAKLFHDEILTRVSNYLFWWKIKF